MARINILRSTSVIISAIGICAVMTLGWFCYRYIYETITTTQASSLLRAPLSVELIDPKRAESADAFLRGTAALPTIDPATIRDVFRAPVVDERSRP